MERNIRYHLKNAVFTLLFLLPFGFSLDLLAQYPGSGAPAAGTNNGRFYGKVVDENGKGVGYATVQLFGMQFDPETKTMKEGLIAGQITEDNGDFSLESLPVAGDFTLKISFIGYTEIQQTVTFGIKPPAQGAPSGGFPQGSGFPGGSKEKDLGNIKLVAEAQSLETVEVTAERTTTMLALDRKVYNVEKDISTGGGNATDALKNVPSLSVDIDGNVSLRNGSPQIFVDGRPTTFSLDQIAADAIESIEVITNPSAKFDAGGGTAGIINIVLKKEKRLGYNGNLRAGTDSRGGINGGGDVNARGEKTNFFVSGNLNRMNGKMDGETFRQNLTGATLTNLTQSLDNEMKGYFANARAGIDWFMDNRNTLTFSGNFTRGSFNPLDEIATRTDSLLQGGVVSSQYIRTADQDRNFRNIGTSLQFKHLFPKEGAEWTADLNYNRVRFIGGADYKTEYESNESLERNDTRGRGQFITFQTDFVNPVAASIKLEGGVRGALRRNRNDVYNSFFNSADNEWVPVTTLADHYKFSDDVYAAYTTLSHQFPTWGYQVGLRAESSFYTGALTDRDSSFSINYPLNLFPSAFVTKKLNETDQLQLAYTRRINRPNFFQTMPFIDFADSLNLRRGNPQLKPEFTNSLELSYQNIFARNHNLLISIYYKQASDLITTYLLEEFNEDLDKNVIVTTFANSNSSRAYGAEMTIKNSFAKIIDLTSNLNVFQTKVDASNVEADLVVERLSWFIKENLSVKLPAHFTLQLTGEYRSKASFTPGNSNAMPWMNPTINTAQGYALANWFVDAALRKDFLQRKASLTLNVSDIFATRKSGTYVASDLFIQDSYRVGNPQVVRLNFSYRFGKMDASLFKRKNMKQSMQGNDMMQ